MLPENPTSQNPASPPSQTMNPQSFWLNLKNNPKLLLLLAATAIILLTILTVLSLGNTNTKPKKGEDNQAENSVESNISDLFKDYGNKETFYPSAISPALNNPPKTEFKYILKANASKLIAQAEAYRLNTNITQIQAAEIAKKFGINTSPTLIGLSNFRFFDEQKRLDIVVYQKTGAFIATFLTTLTSTETKSVKIENDSQAVQEATSYLKSLNLWDDSLVANMGSPFPKNPVVYKRVSTPNIFFVEFHRGWTVMPILNQIGLLNSKLDEQLQDPKKFLDADKDIVYSSDGLTGFQRPDQFNTVTVGIKTDGEVGYLKYYLRSVKSKTQVSIKPFDQAFEELKNGKGLGLLVYPVAERRSGEDSGSDYTPEQWRQLFPEGKASSNEAVIDDVQLAYEEKLITEPQELMVPMYIFRGRAPLKSGLIVNFVALVDGRGS